MPIEPTLDTAFFRRWLELATEAVHRESPRLTELDSPIGDADHGSNLDRGFTAVAMAVRNEPPQSPGALLIAAGRTLVSSVGGASGPLYGTALRRAGKSLGAEPQVTAAELGAALAVAVQSVQELGGAAVGDKTMVDALLPASQAYTETLAAGGSAVRALSAAADAALAGATATIALQARKGRASYLGKRSIGHQDPGATSSALLLACLRDAAVDSAGTPDQPQEQR